MKDCRITKLIITSATILLLSNSCYYDVENELYSSVNCETPEIVSYQDDIGPLVQNSCATSNCHSATGSALGNFETYDGIKAKANNGTLKEAIVTNQSMPPSQPLNPCDIKLIEVWIEQGAPNN